MASCPTNPQPPDIEELCKQEKPRVQQRRRTMTLQDREPKHTTTMNNSNNSNNNVRGLPRSVSDMNVVAFCTCQQSRDFPFCDNTHSIFNKATNSNMAPLYVAFVEGECNDCSTKGKSKLSHSVDQTISHKRGSITQTHNNNKLHTSADVIATSCCCKPLSPNDTLAHTNTSQITEKQQSSTNISRSSSPNNETTTPIPTSSPSATIINKSTPTTPTNATIDETSSTTTTIDNDTCNTTKGIYLSFFINQLLFILFHFLYFGASLKQHTQFNCL